MKKLFCIICAVFLIIGLCSCEIYNGFNVSEIMETVESSINELEKNTVLTEISYDDPFVYNTYYDSGYTALNDKQKEIYEQLYLIALQMPEGYINVCDFYDGFYNDTGIAYNAMINDHPDFFWMPYTYMVGELTDSTGSYNCIAFCIEDNGQKYDYLVTKENRDVMRTELEQKITEIVSEADNYDSLYLKEKFFNDYICDNTVYDENATLSHTSYGCLISGKALCEGYSRAFKLLCNQVGIRCDLIYGRSQNDDHMWNCVNINGNYNYVDVTWNDSGEEYRYIYFNMTDKQMLADRELYPHFTEVGENGIQNGDIINFVKYECNYIKNSYFYRNGLILNEKRVKQIARKTEQYKTEGAKSISLCVDDEKLCYKLKKGNLDIIEDIQNELSECEISEYLLVRDVLILFLSTID